MNGGLVLTHEEFCRKGGAAKSEAKLKAAMANLQRAKAVKAAKLRATNGKP